MYTRALLYLISRIKKKATQNIILEYTKGRLPKKNVCFFYKSYKGGGGAFPFIKIYVADFV